MKPLLCFCREQIQKLFEWLVPPCVRCVQKSCKLMVPMQEANLVQALARIFRSVMDPQLSDPAQVRAHSRSFDRRFVVWNARMVKLVGFDSRADREADLWGRKTFILWFSKWFTSIVWVFKAQDWSRLWCGKQTREGCNLHN